MTLREYITHWQKTYDLPKSRPSTYAAHGYIFKNHILPGLGEIPLSELSEQQIGDFMEERRQFGGHRPESPEYPGLGIESIRHIQTLLQQVLEKALQDGLLKCNPAKPFRLTKPKTVRADILTPLEIEAYLDAAEQLGYLPMFMLALTAGLRQRELIALKWSDLNTESRMLTIHEGRSVVCGQLVEYGGELRNIPLSENMTALLKREHDRHPSSLLMFMHPGTLKPFAPPMVRRMHDEITQEAGLHHVRFADLRHTCAVTALQNGMEIPELARILGHARTTMTRQDYSGYVRQTADPELQELKAASEQMENMLGY